MASLYLMTMCSSINVGELLPTLCTNSGSAQAALAQRHKELQHSTLTEASELQWF